MSFSEGQMKQLGAALAAAEWTAGDVTLLGQAGRDRLVGIRDSLRRGGDIISAIEGGKVELWLAPGQDTGWERGRVILIHLNATGILASCADLAELEVIQAKRVVFFRKHFKKKYVFGWRSASDDYVPYLCESGGKVILRWSHLGSHWHADDPALRRK